MIKRILNTGYCHHIEGRGFRWFWVHGEIHPNEIYHWFMSLFVDAYDWVMVPNVYCMSQNADGGLITLMTLLLWFILFKKMSCDDFRRLVA